MLSYRLRHDAVKKYQKLAYVLLLEKKPRNANPQARRGPAIGSKFGLEYRDLCQKVYSCPAARAMDREEVDG